MTDRAAERRSLKDRAYNKYEAVEVEEKEEGKKSSEVKSVEREVKLMLDIKNAQK